MSASKPSDPRFKCHKTRDRAITYRVRDGGVSTYAVYVQGTNIRVEGGERQALTRRAELRGKAARGERVVTATKAGFSEVAEQWYESKIARGVLPVALTKVMGHKNGRLTLDSYTHLYDRDRTGDALRAAIA